MEQHTPSPRQFILGSALAMTTMLVWSGWNVMSRLGVTQALSVYDVVFLRFIVAGLLALPIFVRAWPRLRNIRWYWLFVMITGSGAPYVLLASYGFKTAPASHGTLIPGVMLLCVAIVSAIWLKESFNLLRITGYVLIAATVIFRFITHSNGMAYLIADLWFLLSGIIFAAYTLANKHTGIWPLDALALVAVGSMVGFCLPYGLLAHEHLASLPFMPSVMQMVYQGVVVSFFAFFCYNKAITLIGPSRTSAFAAAIPVLTTLVAMPVLGEMPTTNDWWFVGLLSVGVLLSTGVLRRLLRIKA